MAPPVVSLGHNDITDTLDQLFANNSVADLIPSYSRSWREIEEGPDKLINQKGAYYLLQTRKPSHIVSEAYGASAAGLQFPEANKSKFLLMNVAAVQDRATIQWDGNVDVENAPALKQKPAKNLDYVKNMLKGIYEAYGRDKSRQLWQNRTNEVGRVSAINTGTRVVTCNNSGNLFNAQLIEEGDILEVRDSGGTLKGYVMVESVYRPSKTFVIDANYIQDTTESTVALATLGIANNDRLYQKGAYNAGWAGVPTHIATSGSYQSLADRTVHDHLTGVQIATAGKSASWALLMKLNSAQRFRKYGIKARGKFRASAQLDALFSTGMATQAFGQKNTLSMGYDEEDISFRGLTFAWDYFVPRDEIHFSDLKAIDKFTLREFKPIRHENGYEFLAPGVDRHYDKTNIYLKGIGNTGAEIPAAVGGALTGLSTAGLALGDD